MKWTLVTMRLDEGTGRFLEDPLAEVEGEVARPFLRAGKP